MIKGKLDDIIQKFCGDDDLRPAMMKPQFEPDTKLIIATNAHILIVAPDKYFDSTFEHQQQYPNWRGVMPNANDAALFKLKTHDILAEIKLIPVVDIYDLCNVCGGEGLHECSCGNNHDCEKCQGTGDGEKVIGQDLDDNFRFVINKIPYSCKLIGRLAHVALRLGIDEVSVFAQKEKSCMLWVLDDVKLLIMPISQIDENYKHIELQTI